MQARGNGGDERVIAEFTAKYGIAMGESVLVRSPNPGDGWQHAFEGHIASVRKQGGDFIVCVVDQEDDAWDMLPEAFSRQAYAPTKTAVPARDLRGRADARENKKYPREDWEYAVANHDTVLGYKDWVEHQMEMNGKER